MIKRLALAAVALLLSHSARAQTFDLDVQADSTYVTTGTLTFTVFFFTTVVGFDDPGSDLSVATTGTVAAGTPVITGSSGSPGSEFFVAIPILSGDGTIQLTIPAGAAMADSSSDLNTEASSAVVTVDNTAPVVSVGSLSRTTVSAANLTPITFDVSIAGADFADFAPADVTLTDNSGGDATALVDLSTVFGKAMTFGGEATRMDPTEALAIDETVAGLTMEAWVKADPAQDGGVIMNYDGLLGYGLSLVPADPGTFAPACGNFAPFPSTGLQSFEPGDVLLADRWYHVACTFDPSAVGAELTLYINGLAVASGSGTATDYSESNEIFTVGAGGSPGNPFGQFLGEIDEVRVWSVARTQGQLAASLSAPITAQAGLLAYWRFDAFEDLGEGADGADDIRDFSGNDFHLDSGAGMTITEANALFGATQVALSNFSGNGTLDIDLAAGIGGDSAGNGSAAVALPETITVATSASPPTVVSITPDDPGPTNGNTIVYRVIFSEAISGFANDDLQLTLPVGRTVDTLTIAPISGGTDFDVTVALVAGAAGDGNLVLTIPAGAVQADSSGLLNTSPLSSAAVRVDNIPPEPAISTTAGSPRDASPFVLDIVFDEAVTGFDASDIPVSNATLGTVSGSGTTYAVTVTPSIASGTVSLGAIPAFAATDLAGNSSIPSQTGVLEIVIDVAGPVLTSAPLPTITAATFTRRLSFNEPVTGFTADDLSLSSASGDAAGQVDSLVAVPALGACATLQCYDLTIGSVTGQGELGITLLADRVADAGTNLNAQQTLTQAVDRVAPSVLSSSVNRPTAGVGTTISFTINASEPILRWDPAQVDVLTTGTAAVTPLYAVEGSGFVLAGGNPTFTISYQQSGNGTVGLRLNAGSLQDLVGTPSTAAHSTPVITVDNTVPDLLSLAPEIATPQIAPDVVFFAGVLSEPVPDFVVQGFTVTQAGGASLPPDISSLVTVGTPSFTAPDRFRVGVDISALPRGESFNLFLNASLTLRDGAGNQRVITGRQSTAAQLDLVPGTAPLLSTARPLTNASPIAVQVSFAEAVTGFVAGDVLVTGGTVSAFTGSGMDYSVSITPAGDGSIAVVVPANVARNAAGRQNQRSEQLDLVFDGTPPVITAVGTDVGPTTNLRNFQLLFEVSEPLDRSTLIAALLANATTTSLLTVAFSDSGAGQPGLDVIDVELLGSSGTLTIALPAGAVTDLAGNATTAPIALPAPIVFDSGKPEVIDLSFSFVDAGNPIISGLSDSISASSVTIEFDFGEPVTGLEAGDFRIDRDSTLGFGSTELELIGDSGGRFSILELGGDGVLGIVLRADAISDDVGNRNDEQLLVTRNINNLPLEVATITAEADRVFEDAATFIVTWSKPVERVDEDQFLFVKNGFATGLTPVVTPLDSLRSQVSFSGSAPGEPSAFGLGEFTLGVAELAAFDRFGNPNQNPEPVLGPPVERVGGLDANGFFIVGIEESTPLGGGFSASGANLTINGVFALRPGSFSPDVARVEFDGRLLRLIGTLEMLGEQQQVLADGNGVEIDTETLALSFAPGTGVRAVDVGGLVGDFRACGGSIAPDRRGLFLAGGIDFTNYFISRVFLDPQETTGRVFPGAALAFAPGAQPCSPSPLAFQVVTYEATEGGFEVDVRLVEDLSGDETSDPVELRGRIAARSFGGPEGRVIPVGTFDLSFSGFDWSYDAITFRDGPGGELRLTGLSRAQAGLAMGTGDFVIGVDLTTVFPNEILFTSEVFIACDDFPGCIARATAEVLTMQDAVFGRNEVRSARSIPLAGLSPTAPQPLVTARLRPGDPAITLEDHALRIDGAIALNTTFATITSTAYETAFADIDTNIGRFFYEDVKFFHDQRLSEGTLYSEPAAGAGGPTLCGSSVIGYDIPLRIRTLDDELRWGAQVLLPNDVFNLTGNNPVSAGGSLADGDINLIDAENREFCFFNLPPDTGGFLIPQLGGVQINPFCMTCSRPPPTFTATINTVIPIGKRVPLRLAGNLSIISGVWDSIRLALSGFEVPVSTTGTFLTGVDVGLNNLAQIEDNCVFVYPNDDIFGEPEKQCTVSPIEFRGALDFSAGPVLAVRGAQIIRPLAAKSTTKINNRRINSRGDLRLLEPNVGPKLADAVANLIYDPFSFKATADSVDFPGLSDSSAEVGAGNLYVNGKMESSIDVPDEVPVVGGLTLAGMGLAINTRKNGDTYSADIKGTITLLGVSVKVTITTEPSIEFDVSDKGSAPLRAWENGYSYAIDEAGRAKGAPDDDAPRYVVLENFGQASKRYGSSSKVLSSVELTSSAATVLRLSWERAEAVPRYFVTAPDGTPYRPDSVERDVNVAAAVGYLENLAGRDASYVLQAPTPGTYVVEVANPEELGEYAIEVLVQDAAPSFAFVNTLADGTELFLDWVAADEDGPAEVTFFLDSDRRGLDGVPIAGPFEAGVTTATVVDLAAQLGAPGVYWVYAQVEDGLNAPVSVYADEFIVIASPDAPPAVRGIDAVASGTTAIVSWLPSPDPEIDGYVVQWTTYIGGVFYEDSLALPVGVTSTIVADLQPNTRYQFTVTASKPIPDDADPGAGLALMKAMSRGKHVDDAHGLDRLAGQLALLKQAAQQATETPSANLDAWKAGKLSAKGQLPEVEPANAISLVVEVDVVETTANRGENNRPEFLSEPDRAVGFQGVYRYEVEVRDRDGDPVTVRLVEGPPGMMLNGAVLSWQPNGAQGGFPVTLEASDGQGTTTQDWELVAARRFPDGLRIVGGDPGGVAAGETLSFEVAVRGGCGTAVTYRLLQAPAGMTVDSAGRVSWLAQDDAAFQVAASQTCDGQRIEATRSYFIDVEAADGDSGNFVGFPQLCGAGPTATVVGDRTIVTGQDATIQATLTGAGPWSLLWSDGVIQRNVRTSPAQRVVQPDASTTYAVLAVSDTVCSGTAAGESTVTVEARTPQAIPITHPLGLLLLSLLMFGAAAFGLRRRQGAR